MDVNAVILYQKKIGLLLIFFCFSVIYSCKKSNGLPIEIDVNYEGDDALNVTFISDRTTKDINFFLQGMQEPILGDFEQANHEILFRPIVPFGNGKTYEIRYKAEIIGEFSVKALTNAKKPTITAIYPSTDTVPENLLKMYLVFSKPMQEVQNALDFIEVYNVTDQTATTIFLELQNELWNANHTKLTLWLDPGRIKTDLIPNRTKGIPLEAGKHYTVRISSRWKDAENNALDSTYVKQLYANARDRSKISLEDWTIKVPKQGSVDKLILDTNEPLDAMLALETLSVEDEQNNTVDGVFELAQKEKQVVFIPSNPWNPGNYKVSVLSLLEDLAGNNLNHLFDVDLKDTQHKNRRTEQQQLSFKVL